MSPHRAESLRILVAGAKGMLGRDFMVGDNSEIGIL